jgi:V/A-type H+-transporting ATPase subunit I
VAGAYDRYEVIAGEGVVAAFVPAEAEPIDDVLVGVPFAALEVPEVEGGTDPEAYVADLERERERLESELETVKAELEDVKHEAAGFLLAAEEALSIRVQKAEAPLQFATTEHAFVAEGWVPTADLERLRRGLDAAVGDRVDVDEVERADYDGHAPDEHGAADGEGASAESPAAPAAADGGTGDGDEEIVADGGSAMAGSAGDPPVVQQNPAPVKPFEALVEVINRPKYDEFDPSVVLFLTFPAFFGFMIGDLGYGILYVLIGYLLYDRAIGATLQSLGGIAMWAGGFTALFGVLYGEFFGLHQLGEIVWDGHPPMHKGLQPHFLPYAQAWLVLSLLAGILHLTVGYAFDFVERLEHGLGEAVTESGSWVLLMNGVWVWILSTHLAETKPGFLFDVFAAGEGAAFEIGFAGFSPAVGQGALAVAGLGFALLLLGEGGIGLLESLNVLVNVLSYTRIAAVLLAKAGMAFVVNLLFFGAYQHDGEFHFLIDHGPEWVVGEYGAEALMFPGMFHGGIAALIGGLLVLVVGHLLVLALGITSAGLQAVRLEYVEFFGKFYEGGGERYEPFGRERRFTARE